MDKISELPFFNFPYFKEAVLEWIQVPILLWELHSVD